MIFISSINNSFFAAKDWRAEGLAIGSTVSDEAVKLYDAAITQVSHPLLSSLDFNCFDLQLIGWFDDPNMGGLPNTIDNMVSADPDFGLFSRLFRSTLTKYNQFWAKACE